MSWLSSALGFDSRDPEKEASAYYNQIPAAMAKYEQAPYERGERAGTGLENYYKSLMRPQEHYNMLMSGYQPSKGYQLQQGEMSSAAANTAAAGGMRGSGADQLAQNRLTQALLSQDMQRYLDNLRGMEHEGGQVQQGLYGIGTRAGSDMANTLANVLGTKASMAFRSAEEENQRPWDLLKGGFGAAGAIGGWGMPGGGSVGGTLAQHLMNYFGE